MNTRKIKVVFFISLFVLAVAVCDASAGWLIYHKPSFQGKIVDNETKEPIEGVVVVAVYWDEAWIGLSVGGPDNNVVHVKEVLTDKNGEFRIGSYTTLIRPFAVEGDSVDFIIYKPGYKSFPNYRFTIFPLKHFVPEFLFSKEIGAKGEYTNKSKIIPFTYGVVELGKLRSENERLRSVPRRPTDYRSKELPLLYKAINEERKFFGLGEVK